MEKYKRITDKRLQIGRFYEPKSKEERSELIDLSKQLSYENVYTRLAELETKIENGTLIELPCKVGDTVYQTDGVRIYQGKIGEIMFSKEHTIFVADIVCFDERAIGLGIFLTQAEAEKKVKELKDER